MEGFLVRFKLYFLPLDILNEKEPFIQDNIPSEGKAELTIAKNRNGGLITALVGWEANNTKFYEL